MSIEAEIVSGIIKGYYAYLSDCEKNSTEMQKNIAVLKARIGELQANRELVEQYFDYKIEERKRLFDLASEALEKAMKTGNTEMAQIATAAIAFVNSKSPFSF